MPYPSPHERHLQAQFRVCLAIAFAVLVVLLALMALTL